MVIPVGRRAYAKQLAAVYLKCEPCGRRSPFGVFQRIERVVFFVPLFTAGTSYVLKCGTCRSSYDIAREDAEFLVAAKDDRTLAYEPRSTAGRSGADRQRRG